MKFLKRTEKIIEAIIFASRWIQSPVYLALIVASGAYALHFIMEAWHCINHYQKESDLMLGILGLVDATMVLNLVTMVTIGGWATFVSKLDLTGEDKPDWLDKINVNTLKTKLAASLVSISAIHLLKTFIDIENLPPEKVWLQIAIHTVFLVTSVFFSRMEKDHH